jgi:hypothetical protein
VGYCPARATGDCAVSVAAVCFTALVAGVVSAVAFCYTLQPEANPLEDRIDLQNAISRLIDTHTLHGVAHVLVDVCYARARTRDLTKDFDLSARWRFLARMMTDVEATAATHSL